MAETKKGYVPTTFKDAGTEKEYAGGKEHDFTHGEYDNFKAAGLIGDKLAAGDAKVPANPAKGGTAA
ncbi:hypothetical protein [Sphingomonas azotifigens]|uniref:hypothetical protein n=1 Tax=Sphingomonas azotifigens TaxID=330920 RepID=UPI0009FC5918|nr:hypothetical protein [Sphingomonas azotifigens]